MNVPQGIIQQQSPQQNIPSQMQPMVPPQMTNLMPSANPDNITKVKSLVGPLKESLKNIFQSAAQLLNQDTSGNVKQTESNARFDKYLEEFYSICDQIELHLITAKKCTEQAYASQVYLPVPVVPTRSENMAQENALTYMQYLDLVKTQITYAKEIHDTLLMAAQNI
ncbi:mediator of RNA polymerase II transcription subunit 29-like [Chironomus tepperi]|uniref:mediator of RNA polymerase II transcription subunit 29-like n=1 Tax=Chironomus tepperi TaxID=113505 RepID=UPI00391F0444